MNENDNPRSREDFEALPYGTVCVDNDGAVFLKTHATHDHDKWVPHNELVYGYCRDLDMAEAAQEAGTRIVYRPDIKAGAV